jgi:Bacterial Ig-like domain
MNPSESLKSGSSPPQSRPLLPIGDYQLELGSTNGIFALFTTQAEVANADGLAQALNAEAEAKAEKTADLLEGPLDDASSVTATSERCLTLFNAIAAGEALDPKVVSQELDAALALLARLDRSGRHKEVLRLARDLSALLALLLRWLELVRTLRLALTTAHALGDRSAEAWALHELGSLHLAGGQPKKATEHLHRALELQQELKGYGVCVTRHNLDAAERDTAGHNALRKVRRRRRLRFVGASALIVLLATGGVALGTRVPPGHPNSHGSGSTSTQSQSTGQPTTTTQPTTTQSTTTQSTTIPPVDNTKPVIVLNEPAAQSYLATDMPTFSGAGGLAPGDLATITLTIYSGSTTSGTAVERFPAQRDPASGEFSVPANTQLAEGSYTAVATQRDRHDNVGTAHVSFTIDLTKPIVSFTAPKNGSSTSDNMPTFQGTAGTLPSDKSTITITVSILNVTTGSWSVVETLTTDAVDGTWTRKSDTALTDGAKFQAVVSQSDQAGNTGSKTILFSETPYIG